MRRVLDERAAGRTVGRLFLDTVSAHPDAVALRSKDGDEWREWTWRQYADLVARVAGGLRERGVEQGDRVVLMMRNRPEFHVADTAVLFLGATPISIYNSSSPEQVQYLVEHCRASAGIFEDAGYLERILKVRGELPNLRDLVVIDDPDVLAPADIGHFAGLCGAEPLDLSREVDNAKPNDLATVIYTSGTTGPPKGVVLDHANICWTVESYRETLGVDTTGWRALSYLPMAHIAERMSTHYLGIASGFEVTTCPEPGQAAKYLPEVHPQTFFAVPRVWEKLHTALVGALNADPERAAQGQAALDVGWEVSEYRARGEDLPDELRARFEPAEPMLAAVRGMIGLDQLVVGVTGAAPIPVEVLRFFRSLGVPMSEIYGLSETSGPMTWDPYAVRVGTVGRAMPGIEVRLADDGEVLCRGGNVFRGYLNAPDKTAEVLDDEGWFHTGDIGQFDDDGYLRIVDRKKELIVTAGGKNISPANLEAALKAGTLIGQACVIGDNRPFICALVVLDTDIAPTWAKSRGIDTTTLAELAEHPDVREEIERQVGEANARFSRVEQIKKFTILPHEWVPDSEELTPT
ncbi:MAG: long-chain acyl-CoA synthetase, partial [Actinomycetota bacterium]|nr:long-chain acyl-CoA synthetase [Actinomycetota bacterium]